jgi:predicted TIM-barrel fold metal-dependent hydrolase
MEWAGNIVESHVHVAREKFPRVERYLEDMATLGISRAVISQNIGNLDNQYLIDVATRFPDKFKVIVMLDLASPKVVSDILNLRDYPDVVGVRLWASTKGPGNNQLEIWQAISEAGLIASVRGPLDQINGSHFQKVDLFMKISRFENVHLMWAGFYANSGESYPFKNTAKFLQQSLNMFGHQRIMWSGDWNADIENGSAQVCRESFELFTKRLLLTELTDHELDWIMGKSVDQFLNWR